MVGPSRIPSRGTGIRVRALSLNTAGHVQKRVDEGFGDLILGKGVLENVLFG